MSEAETDEKGQGQFPVGTSIKYVWVGLLVMILFQVPGHSYHHHNVSRYCLYVVANTFSRYMLLLRALLIPAPRLHFATRKEKRVY